MKKVSIVFLVLLLVCAGMAMMSCPSEATQGPPPAVLEGDFTLVNGKVIIPLNSIPITDGSEYDMILDITQVYDALLGCHLKGSLFYVSGGKRYLLAGALDSLPNVISVFPRKYRWTFKAGVFGEDGSEEAATKGDYTVPSNGTVPSGATLEFLLTAMTPGWKYFGDSKAEKFNKIDATDTTSKTATIDYSKPDIEADIAGSFDFKLKPNITWVDTGVTVASNGGADTAATGKGNIEGDEWAKVKNAPAGSILRFDCTVKVGAVGSNSLEPGWGFGGVGGNVDGKFRKVRNQEQYYVLLIPKGTPAGSQHIVIDIFVEDVLASSAPDWSFVNTNTTNTSEQKINSIKIYSPQQ